MPSEESPDSTAQDAAECKLCETTLTGDDLTYRVLYGRFEHAAAGNISEKLVAHAGEELDPGADERWYCFDCYKSEFARENGAHFDYDSADQLFNILDASDGQLVADAKVMTIGGRGWLRVVDGEVQARHSVAVAGDADDEYDVKFETEPTPDYDRDDFDELFADAGDRGLVFLKPVSETPFVAGMNRTLGVDYDE